ncbi:hypothetical protein [Saccharothrix luteola]|uniref:hypothetical protein n=1 Tax=Saccharothrix luteola TaxID=2893018 RepID=UPI001E33355B|nr:hypothetical protein [Saccharothrix luteola]MCC8244255.1 hypothetical protein [Saccharothrix luteola]
MTEPVPGQTPEPAVADDAIATPPPAGKPETAEPETAEPEPTAAGEPDTADATDTADPNGTAGADGPQPTAANPQELFGSLSLSAIEADIDRLMSDKMSQLDGMLAGLEDLVQRLEGEITNLEPPPDESDTPKG